MDELAMDDLVAGAIQDGSEALSSPPHHFLSNPVLHAPDQPPPPTYSPGPIYGVWARHLPSALVRAFEAIDRDTAHIDDSGQRGQQVPHPSLEFDDSP